MHIENLKIFSDLVESQNFSRAAKLNGITQSAVSQQLRAMEKHFDALIIDRTQKQFRLTREGSCIYDASKDILRKYNLLRSNLQEISNIVSGTIHLATIYSIGLHDLQPYVKSFLQDFPAVNVRVEYRRSNLVYEDVIHNAVDMGLVAYPVKAPQIEIIPFREDKLVVICSPKSALAQQSSVALENLDRFKIIGFDQDIPTRQATDQLFRDAGLNLTPVMEFDNIETVKRAVEIDAGVAIVPQATIRQEIRLKQLVQVELSGVAVSRSLAIIYRKGRVIFPAMQKFIDLLLTRDLTESD